MNDVHSHLIPGVDDGAKTLDESISILKDLEGLGFKQVVTTPHIYRDLYPNDESDLKVKYQELSERIKELKLNLELKLAAEYFIDDHFLSRIKNNVELLSFGDRYVLIETSFSTLPLIWDEVIFELKSSGYKPVLAHPERYQYIMDDRSFLERLKMNNIKLQVTAVSLIGAYGVGQQKIARYLVKKKWVDFIGTDLHNRSQIEGLNKTHPNRFYQKALALPLLNYQL